jgi:SAM-dependent methyltransferase
VPTPIRQLRERLRLLAARMLRPGIAPLAHRLDRLEHSIVEVVTGSIVGREKYREELEFWRWLLKTPEGRASLGRPPEDAFAEWQRDRLRELAGCLAFGNPGTNGSLDEALDAWCASQSAIEIGPGPYPALAAAPRWKRAVAVDPLARGYAEEAMLPAAAEHIVYLEASGERIPLPAGCADLVIIENALDHVSDPAAVLSEIRRLLRVGGLIWLLVDLSNYSDHMHPHPFNEARIRTLLKAAGFETLSERVGDHKSHPKAYGEYRALLRKEPHPRPQIHSRESTHSTPTRAR